MNNVQGWSLGSRRGSSEEGTEGTEGTEERNDDSLTIEIEENDAWETSLRMKQTPYLSRAITRMIAKEREKNPKKIAKVFNQLEKAPDPLWFQVCFEAEATLKSGPTNECGPLIFSGILSQPDLITAVVKIVSNVLAGPISANPIINANTIQNLFESNLTEQDRRDIALDAMACAIRKPSNEGEVMRVLLFNAGFHALVSHRLAHRLWQQGRKGLAHYIQSAISSRLCFDLHPAATIGAGIYLSAGAGVVIGETAVVGDDVAILQSVTLGGTGKNRGDRHPKIGQGVILQDSCAVLGNIKIGDGAVVTAKSIVLKDVPSYARVSGVPAKAKSFRREKGPVADDYYGRDYSTNLKSGFDGWKAEWLEEDMRKIVLKAFEGYGET